MSVQSDYGRADPRALITWPAPEVAQRLCLLLAEEPRLSLVLELSDCFITPGSPRRAVLSITAESGWVHTTDRQQTNAKLQLGFDKKELYSILCATLMNLNNFT